MKEFKIKTAIQYIFIIAICVLFSVIIMCIGKYFNADLDFITGWTACLIYLHLKNKVKK